MIGTKSIREYLLEAAIHGRLSDNTIEGNQRDILAQIENEYICMLEAKKTKAIVDVEMINEGLFDLPNGWIWVSLGKLCVLLSRGKSPKYSDNKKIPVFAQKCNQPSGLALERALFLDETTLDKWQTFFRLVDGDVLINSTGTGTMGRVGVFLPKTVEGGNAFEIPENWRWVSVGDVCINIQYGSSKKSSKSGEMPVLRMGNIQAGKIVYNDLVYTSDQEEIAKYHLEMDDLLFNRTNSIELVGKTAIYKAEIPAIYAGYLVRLTPLIMLSEYLNYAMQSKYYCLHTILKMLIS